MIINLDEAVNLYKITHREAREKHDYILTIYNDILQVQLRVIYNVQRYPRILEDERVGFIATRH